MSVALLELKNVSLEFGGKKVLDNLSLKVEEGEVHSLMGVNGTGKTSLAYLVMGLEGYRPSSGSILFNGRDITGLSASERAKLGIQLAWQIPASFEGITIRDYIKLGRKEVDAGYYLTLIGLNKYDYLDRFVDGNLSGGERKRVELAATLSLNPKLLILDEPDSGIDLMSFDVLINLIKNLREKGASVLLITHNQKMAEKGDVISLICSGKIVKQGKGEELIEFFKRNCENCEHVGEIKEDKLEKIISDVEGRF